MKGNDKKALHTKTLAELQVFLNEEKALLLKTRMEAALQKVKNVHAVLLIRRKIAIIETIKREKELKGNG